MNTTGHKTIGISAIILISFLTLTCLHSSAQEVGTFKDKRDGNIYSWVKPGKKMWMAENLKFHPPSGAWAYDDNAQHVQTYGYLYDWNSAQSVCPKGWRLPSVDDFEVLVKFFGGDSVTGRNLMELDTLWWSRLDSAKAKPANYVTLLGGTRRGDSTYTGITVWGGLWTSSLDEEEYPIDFLFAKGDHSVSRSSHNKTSAFSVRCIRK